MNNTLLFFRYLAVMAGITYAIRMLPLVLCKKKIKNRLLKSFLHYIPYAVLGAMTFPAIFYSTDSILTATAGCIAAFILAWFEQNLLVVALCASATVLAGELIAGMF